VFLLAAAVEQRVFRETEPDYKSVALAPDGH
jgi:hypothetical protein